MGNSQVVRLAVLPEVLTVERIGQVLGGVAHRRLHRRRGRRARWMAHGWRTFASLQDGLAFFEQHARLGVHVEGPPVPIKDTDDDWPCPPGHSVSTSYARRTSCCRGARGHRRARTPRLGDDAADRSWVPDPWFPHAWLAWALLLAQLVPVWYGWADDLEGFHSCGSAHEQVRGVDRCARAPAH